MRAWIACIALAVVSGCASFQPPLAEQEAAVWKNVEALNDAIFNTRDANAMGALVGEPLSYGHSDGRLENKSEMVKNATESPSRYRNQRTERVSMNIQGSTAITRHTFSGIQTNAQGVDAPLKISVLQTWRRVDGRWELRARQAVRLPT